MSPIRLTGILPVLAILPSIGLAEVRQPTVTWTGGAGNWSEASHWSPAVVPNNV